MRPTIEDRKLYNVDYSKDTDFSAFASPTPEQMESEKKILKKANLAIFLIPTFQ